MKFRETLQLLSEKVSDRKNYVIDKQMTRQLLVIPFLEALGFDVLDPMEVIHDYVNHMGRSKNEKIDYALLKNGSIKIFIEIQTAGEKLKNYSPLLSRFFNASPESRIAILTNGVEYKLFADFNKKGVLDDNSFMDINIANLTDAAVEVLSKLKKDTLY